MGRYTNEDVLVYIEQTYSSAELIDKLNLTIPEMLSECPFLVRKILLGPLRKEIINELIMLGGS